MDGHQRGECTIPDELSDLVLLIDSGEAPRRQLRVLSTLLQIASPVLRDVLRIAKAPGRAEEGVLPTLPVEGSYDGWSALIRYLYLPSLTGEPAELSPADAYAIFPIAHAYNMQGMLRSCTRVVAQQASLPFHCPVRWEAAQRRTSQPHGPGSLPTLLDWLSLADAKQYEPLTQACLGQLSGDEARTSVRCMLAHRSVRGRMEGLRQGTLVELLSVAAGFPAAFKGLRLPNLSAEPTFVHQAPPEVRYRPYGSCIAGPPGQQVLLVPMYDSGDIQVLPLPQCTGGGGAAASAVGMQLGAQGLQGRAPSLLQGHAGHVLESCGNERLALSGGFDGALCVWNLAEARQLRSMQRGGGEAVWGLCFCGADGSRAATGLEHGVLRLWNVETGSQLGKDWSGGREAVVSVSASADGRLLLTGSGDHQLRLWDTRMHAMHPQGEPGGGGGGVRVLQESGVMGHLDAVRSVCLSADGHIATSGSFDGTIKAWDLRLSAMCTATMHVPPQPGLTDASARVWRLCMDPLGTSCLSICQERSSVQLWDVSRGALLATRTWPGQLTTGLCASRDLGTVMVALQGAGEAGGDAGLQLWSA